jgi:hypothetical protein
MSDYRKIVLDNDETNEALSVAGQEARIRVTGYGGPVDSGVASARPLAPGYSGFGKHRAKDRVAVPGYGTVPVTARIIRFPNS